MEQDMSKVGTSLKRRMSDSEDSVQEDDNLPVHMLPRTAVCPGHCIQTRSRTRELSKYGAENITKRQKQEKRDDNLPVHMLPRTAVCPGHCIQTRSCTRELSKYGAENITKRQKQEKRGNSMRGNYFLAATDITTENENNKVVGNGTETEIIANNKDAEEAENGTETEIIAENENIEEVENGTETEIIAENENTEEVENGAKIDNCTHKEGSEIAYGTEESNSMRGNYFLAATDITTENENNKEVGNGTETEIIANNKDAEEAENGTETEIIAENENIEEVENGTETEIIAENENTEEVENGAEIDNCTHKEGSEIAYGTEESTAEKSAENENNQEFGNGGETTGVVQQEGSVMVNIANFVQVPRGTDKCTSVTEGDLIQREEDLDDNVSSRSRTSHKYHHKTSKSWISVYIQRFPEAEPVGSSSERTIYVYNSEKYVSEDVIKNKFRNSLRWKELFYHGTTRESAISIIEQGINLKKAHRVLDFSQGKGFYVTDNYEKACEWSKRKARTYSTGAIIAFAIDSEMRRKERHLSLMIDRDTNRKFWECIVGHFRRGQTSPDVTRVLRDVKYIEGPVAMNRSLASWEIPTPHDKGQFRQLCICDQGYARKFGSLTNILCVIFLKD